MDKRLFGIKRTKLPESEKGGTKCYDCKRGLLFTVYDYQIDALITRCQFCSIVRIDYQKELKANFKTALE